MAIDTNITLYTSRTPNGIKISILLAELDLSYKLHPISLDQDEQKQEWYLKINPNGRIPAITDTLPNGDAIRIFESGAILQYLVDRYDQGNRLSYPRDTVESLETNSWLMWQMSGLGPMQGQANHFRKKIQYGIDRYTNETKRLYRVLEQHLSKNEHGFVVGDHVTIADIACFGWITTSKWADIDLNEFPHLSQWHSRLGKRAGFIAGRNVPELKGDRLDDEKVAKQNAKWIQRGMAEETGKK